MKLTTNIKYWEGYLPTPRSRKKRYRPIKESVEIEIPEFAKEDLRPAFFIPKRIRDEKDKTIYLCGGELYTEVFIENLTAKPNNFDSALEVLDTNMSFRTYETDTTDREKALAEAEEYICDYMVADGVLYRRTNEPLYAIDTYGLGNNHGGTSLNITTHDPSGYIPRFVYSALDAELAVKEAQEVARGRGDTDYVQWIKADIQVLLPEACKFPRRITDPLQAILEELENSKPVEIYNDQHRFNVVSAASWECPRVAPQILAILDCGLRVRLPRKTDGRYEWNWFVNRSDNGILQIEIDWDFLNRKYLFIG